MKRVFPIILLVVLLTTGIACSKRTKIELGFSSADVKELEISEYSVPVPTEKIKVTSETAIEKIIAMLTSIEVEENKLEPAAGTTTTSFHFNLEDGTDFEVIYVANGVNKGVIKSNAFEYQTAADVGVWKSYIYEKENAENENAETGNTEETGLPSVSVQKTDQYEGMEITDWFDEGTVVLAKENRELGKMSLAENSEFYPRSLYLYNLDTKEYKTVKARKNMFLGGAALSPDKKHLLYYEYSIGDTAYYLTGMDKLEQSSVTEGNLGLAYTAKWADNQSVIGVSYAGGAYMADTAGKITPVADLQGEPLYTVQKIQDKLYYITTETADSPFFQLYMLDPATGEKKDLKVPNADGITPSPDGKQILISQKGEVTKKLLLADATGNIQRTVAEGTELTGVSWAPNQRMIAYRLESAVNGAAGSGIYLYDVLSDKSLQIAAGTGSAEISWSPSGKKIAVAGLNGGNYNSSIIYLK